MDTLFGLRGQKEEENSVIVSDIFFGINYSLQVDKKAKHLKYVSYSYM